MRCAATFIEKNTKWKRLKEKHNDYQRTQQLNMYVFRMCRSYEVCGRTCVVCVNVCASVIGFRVLYVHERLAKSRNDKIDSLRTPTTANKKIGAQKAAASKKSISRFRARIKNASLNVKLSYFMTFALVILHRKKYNFNFNFVTVLLSTLCIHHPATKPGTHKRRVFLNTLFQYWQSLVQ